MRPLGLRRLSIVVLVVLSAIAGSFGLVASNVVRDQGRRLLEERAGEVGALLSNSFAGVEASLRSLRTAVAPGHPEEFVQSASPLIIGQSRALLLVRVDGSQLTRVAGVGDGVPAGALSGARLALLRRAMSQQGLVSALITDGPRQRVGLALGPDGEDNRWIVYQEDAIDPYSPDPATGGAAFNELDIALYDADTARPDRLVLTNTTRGVLRGDTASAMVPVGVDNWLVVVAARRPLVGAFAMWVPWMLFLGGLVAAVLAAAVVEVVGRRRDFAFTLVRERTAALRSTVDDLERAQAELVRHAYHDELTHLPNRSLFLNRLEQALEMATREPGLTAVMFVDVDRFKWINDSLGHVAGDGVLVEVAGRLAGAVRPGDTVARLGGDEFVILCRGLSDEAEARCIAARLQQQFLRPIALDGREMRLTISIGISLTAGDATNATADALLRDADIAMYRAKERGRDRVELFDEPLRRRAVAQLEMETALRQAIQRREFVVHYQPVIDVSAGTVVGVEALVRWKHPQRGLIMPVEFIAVAEDAGLIGAIGEYVLSEASAQAAAWNRERGDRRPLTVSVNLSARQLDIAGLAESVMATLETTGLDPALLWLEITESTFMEDAESARAALQALKALGVTLVVDDFGTGYSSLLYLRQFPVDVLKVDQSFVAGLGHSPEDRAIVTGVVRLAQALGLAAVAEGVESAEQHAQLTLLGCDLAQGYYWSPPLPAQDVPTWLDAFSTISPGWRPPADATPPIRVLLVDDQSTVRDLLRLTMQMEGCFDVVAETDNGADAISLAALHQPDLVMLDLAMPVLGGGEALPRILAAAPAAKVVVLSAVDVGAAGSMPLSDAVSCFDKTSDLNAMVAGLPRLFTPAAGAWRAGPQRTAAALKPS